VGECGILCNHQSRTILEYIVKVGTKYGLTLYVELEIKYYQEKFI
jgi:hypothetical protein